MLTKYVLVGSNANLPDSGTLCEVIANANPGDEFAFFETALHMEWLLAKTAIQIIADQNVVVISEKRLRWFGSNGKIVIGSRQTRPIVMWKGSKLDLISGIQSKTSIAEDEHALEALIMYVTSSSKIFGETDVMLAAFMDTKTCPKLMHARLALPPMYKLKRMPTQEDLANEPQFTIM